MSLIVFTSLWMWRVRRSMWWTAAWPTTSPTLSFCGHNAESISSSPLTFLHGPVTPAPHSRSFLQSCIAKNHPCKQRIMNTFFSFLNVYHRSSCWLKNGLEWTGFHSPRSIPKCLTAKAWRNATSSNQEKATRTAQLSSTLYWSTSTSGHSRHLVSMCICGGFHSMCEEENMPLCIIIIMLFYRHGTWGISSSKLHTGIQPYSVSSRQFFVFSQKLGLSSEWPQ